MGPGSGIVAKGADDWRVFAMPQPALIDMMLHDVI